MPRFLLSFTMIICLAVLAGCATRTDIQSSLRGFVGKDVDLAVARLGHPSQIIKRDTHNIYIWETGQTSNYADTFYEQGPPQGAGSDVVDERIFGDTSYFGCAIKLRTDADDVVRSWDFNRGLSRCAQFSKRLSP